MKPISIIVAIVSIVGAGVFDGIRMNRWTPSTELRDAIVNIPTLPLTIGDWVGKDEPMSENEVRKLKAKGMDVTMTRTYTNSRTGEVVSMLIVCGRTGPVAAHTPQACYGLSGFDSPAPAREFSIAGAAESDSDGASKGSKSSFMWIDFAKPGGLDDSALRIYFSWADASRSWRAVQDPRREFALSPILYKMYVVEPGRHAAAPTLSDPAPRFISQVIPQFEKAVFDRSSAIPKKRRHS
jgi:hypothetical protein